MTQPRLTLRGVTHLHRLSRLAERRSKQTAGGRVVRGVESIDLTLNPGSVLGLAGPNGAGKTTLLGLIAGILSPQSGKLQIDGIQLADNSECLPIRAKIGFMPERVGWNGIGTPLSAVSRIRAMRNTGKTAMQALELVGLASRAHDPLNTLSQGMRQRISLATALLDEPDLLLLDEPMNALDPVAQGAFRDMIKEIAADGCSIIISSHQLSDIEKICDEVAILDRGNIVAHGTFTAVEQALNVGQHLMIAGRGENPTELIRDLYPDVKIEPANGGSEDGAMMDGTWSLRLTRRSVAWNIEMRAGLNETLVQSGRSVHHLERAPPDLEELLREATGQPVGLTLREVEQEEE
jgi:ABC-2 type transport system ATP-binding protein